MNLFGNKFFYSAPEEDQPPRKGVALYFQVFWDNLGKLLLTNVFCFAAFLPLMLLVSLGLVYENFWLTIIGGLIGGAIAISFWCASLKLAFHYFRPDHNSWSTQWKDAISSIWKSCVREGAIWGLILAALLFVGQFCVNMIEDGILPAPAVWSVLALDFFLFALITVTLCVPLCFAVLPFSAQLVSAVEFLRSHPGRVFASALTFLIWYAFWLAMFPVSVPFAAVLAFWPMLLLIAQLYRPILWEQEEYAPEEVPNCVSENEPKKNTDHTLGNAPQEDPNRAPGSARQEDPNRAPGSAPLTLSERFEIFMRRFWPLVVGILVVVSLGLGALRTILSLREPDLSVAFIHSDSLPDNVKNTLEASLEELVGDLNGDGVAYVEINDYEVIFDGSATDSDMQTAGMTLLITDLAQSISSLYIAEDADGFLSLYADQVDTDHALIWKDSTVLSLLDAGVYSQVEDIDVDHTGQELLAGYTIFPESDCSKEILALFGLE